MESEEEKLTLAQAIQQDCVPKYNKKRSKKINTLLAAIGRNLPEQQLIPRLKKVLGSELIEDKADSIGGEAIDPKKEYTVFENIPTKVNHLKRLKQAWDMSNSPFNVIFYGFKFIREDFKNEWIEVINDAFNTEYPLADREEIEVKV